MTRKRKPGIRYNRPLLGFPTVYFVAHALQRMSQRSITREDIYRTIENPDVSGLPTQEGRIRVRWEKTARHYIDVVYELKADGVRVVTTWRGDNQVQKGKPPRILRPKSPKTRKPRGRKKR